MTKPDLKVLPGGQRRTTARGSSPRRKTLLQAITSGTELEQLVARRAQVARALDNPRTSPSALASLNRRFDLLDDRIAVLEGRPSKSAEEPALVDEPWDPSAV